MKYWYLLIFFLSLPAYAGGLNPWLGLNVQKKLADGYVLLWENQYRLFEGTYSELQWRLGLIYQVNKYWSVAGGGFTSFNKNYRLQERRLWQQVIFLQNIYHHTFLVRYRQEQRDFNRAAEFAHRSRIQMRFNYHFTSRVVPYVATEFFFGLNEARRANFPRGYNQNRTQLGVVWKLNPHMSVENSYMHVYNRLVNTSSNNHVLWTSFQFKF